MRPDRRCASEIAARRTSFETARITSTRRRTPALSKPRRARPICSRALRLGLMRHWDGDYTYQATGHSIKLPTCTPKVGAATGL